MVGRPLFPFGFRPAMFVLVREGKSPNDQNVGASFDFEAFSNPQPQLGKRPSRFFAFRTWAVGAIPSFLLSGTAFETYETSIYLRVPPDRSPVPDPDPRYLLRETFEPEKFGTKSFLSGQVVEVSPCCGVEIWHFFPSFFSCRKNTSAKIRGENFCHVWHPEIQLTFFHLKITRKIERETHSEPKLRDFWVKMLMFQGVFTYHFSNKNQPNHTTWFRVHFPASYCSFFRNPAFTS